MLNLDIDDFLKNYWQKKPLLIRKGLPNYQSPISAEELAGLACEDFIESRIIIENKNKPKWSLENGPFTESHFTNLPKTHWTVLIQGLNKIFPEFDDLLREFNFIPSWRVDDLMASYAAPDGSVGPHIDQYDVFLLQASGERKWMISSEIINEDNYEENIPLKIIKNFKAEFEWTLEAGDILYLPANVAHYGVGLENCITFSIGFRAPSHTELLTAYIDDHINEIDEKLRYQDPQLTQNINSGEISEAAIDSIQKIFIEQFNNREKLADWFGEYITDYLNDHEDIESEKLNSSEFIQKLKKLNYIRRTPTVRANYHIHSNQGQIALYINGSKQRILPNIENIIRLFCDQHIINYSDIQPYLEDKNAIEYLCQLYNNGYLEYPDE